MTTSLLVAEAFEKNHKDVMRVIHTLYDEDDHERNFAPMVRQVEIGSGATRNSPYYEMTRKGFTRLIMKFSGPKASKVKDKFNGCCLATSDAFYLMANRTTTDQSSSHRKEVILWQVKRQAPRHVKFPAQPT